MTIEEKVYAVLSAASGVTALATAGRIKPHGADLQSLARPYIVHSPFDIEATQLQEGIADLQTCNYQISAVADSYPEARALATAIQLAIGTYIGNGMSCRFIRNMPPVPDPDVRVIQIVSLFWIADML